MDGCFSSFVGWSFGLSHGVKIARAVSQERHSGSEGGVFPRLLAARQRSKRFLVSQHALTSSYKDAMKDSDMEFVWQNHRLREGPGP